jgi:hypothetical protein
MTGTSLPCWPQWRQRYGLTPWPRGPRGGGNSIIVARKVTRSPTAIRPGWLTVSYGVELCLR